MIGAIAGGTMGDLGTVLLDLVKKSEGFAKVLEAVNGVLQEVADTLGTVFAVVTPVVQSLGEALKPLLDAIRPLLMMLVRLDPVFLMLSMAVRLLQPAIEILTKVVTRVTSFVTASIVGFLTIIRMIMNKLGIDTDAVDEMIEVVEEAAAPLDELGNAADGVGEAMINVPVGFKVASDRLSQQSGEEPPESRRIFDRFFGGNGGANSTDGQDSAAGSITIVSNDPDEIWQKLSRLMERDGFQIAAS